ncbi:hypothetical protein [Bacillus sp. OK048]|uniref:hypothetical protein n=1 Tax=Bacillus sp. OK048 TaxID=1882761 RepID=UPI00087F370A|nr:hypothetical protein [Bacillus sp. OK048]SDN01871.1 hypothetical protein SAMN05443253_107172 [Bacillus sp. OK048]
MKKWIILLLFTVLLLAACQKGNDNTAYNLRNDVSSPNYMSNKADNKPGPMSDQNPNFLNLRGTSLNDESNRNNFGRDIDIAREIVNRTDDFRSDSIWINNAGDKMTVTVDDRGRFNGNERDNALDSLQKKLLHALPRYSIEIRQR